jgi:acyl-CoA dehydrogenase
MDFTITEELKAVQKAAREFMLKEILPIAWYYDERGEIPLFLLRKAFDQGLMNADIPKAYGGQGRGMLAGVIAIEEFAAGCSGLATSLFGNSLGYAPILISDKDQIKQRYLPEITRQFKLICFGTSEPTMGSDVAGMRCIARKDGDDYILDGTKYWITNGGIADYMSVFATTDPKLSHKGIAAFVVDLKGKGVSIGKTIPKLGQRCSNTVGIRFKDVRVPKENVLANPGEGFVLAMKTFDRTRPPIAAFAVGAARSAMEFALDYAKRRRTFGVPISDNQAIQFKLADMFLKIETARLLTWKAAYEVDQGIVTNATASIAKLYATESAFEVVNEAVQILGGYGYTKMYPMEKLMRDIRLLRIYEGTSEIQHLILSGHLIGSYQPVMPPLSDLPILRWEDQQGEFSDTMQGTKAWRCPMCGYIHLGDEPPDECPYCFVPGSGFKLVR